MSEEKNSVFQSVGIVFVYFFSYFKEEIQLSLQKAQSTAEKKSKFFRMAIKQVSSWENY